jgi:hypothetical protein
MWNFPVRVEAVEARMHSVGHPLDILGIQKVAEFKGISPDWIPQVRKFHF